MEWKQTLSGAVSVFWGATRTLGVAGLPDDVNNVLRVLDMIPDWIGVASLTAFCIFSWQAWGGRVKSAVRKVLGRARRLASTIKINNAEYIPFDNLVDVIGAVDMKPLGTDGVRYGALPKGTNLVCLPNGRVRLALPVRLEAAGSLGIVASSSAAVLKTSPPQQEKPDDS